MLATAAGFAAQTPGAGASTSTGRERRLPNGQGTLLVIGDSLMEGTSIIGALRGKLESLRTWENVVIDFKRGRTTVEGTRILSRRLAASPQPTAIVVALGTNDMLHHSKYDYASSVIDGFMQETLAIPTLWVDISFSRNHPDWRLNASRFNRALLAARQDWPNLSVARWSRSFVPAGRSNYIIDGIHLSNSGYRTRSTWMAQQVALFGTALVNSSTTTSTTVPSTSTTVVVPTTTVTTIPSTTTAAATSTTVTTA